ncbi:unnamed protein product [Prunus brigantina]
MGDFWGPNLWLFKRRILLWRKQLRYGRAVSLLRNRVTTWFVSSRILRSLSKVFVALLVEGVGLCTQFLPSSAMSNGVLKGAGGIRPPGIIIKRRIILRRWHYRGGVRKFGLNDPSPLLCTFS